MELTLGPYRMEIATEFGPRIISLRRDHGPELLAQLGPDVILTFDGGEYRFRGGHRLWASPEIASITYAPDDHQCLVSEAGDSVTVSAPPDQAGLVKEITVSQDGDSLIVDHSLTNAKESAATVAPWALTQLPLGGTAILPMLGDDTAPSANRYLVIWPYTSVEDRRVTFHDDALEFEASAGPPIKFGVGPTPGRLGYYRDGVVFIKEIEAASGKEVPDFGAVGQVYIGEDFCELESVGGVTDLSGGGAAVLRERWTAVECADTDTAMQLTVQG
jgi:hypothetical protein